VDLQKIEAFPENIKDQEFGLASSKKLIEDR